MPPEQLNVVALVSGGKDSFFCLLHCLAQGHHVVAMANLYPEIANSLQSGSAPSFSGKEDQAKEGTGTGTGTGQASTSLPLDLNSYMYQTAGHALIPLYAQALPFPLFRQPIVGTARDQGREYAGPVRNITSRDEVESMSVLLQRVLAAHPEANAVCSGAILSTYQRTRVESICTRLGLTSLAYLWQYPVLPRRPFLTTARSGLMEQAPDPSPVPPAVLLEDIADAGLDARIVKVASGGLDHEDYLWESLGDDRVRGRLQRVARMFRSSPLGEGGEYETLVVSGPPSVWRGKVQVEQYEMVAVVGGGGEASLLFNGGKAVLNETNRAQLDLKQDLKHLVHIPPLWDPGFFDILRELDDRPPSPEDEPQSVPSTTTSRNWRLQARIIKTKRALHVSNLTGSHGSTIENQMNVVAGVLQAILAKRALQASDIVFTTILLRSIQDFARINTIYSQLFTEPIPPARVTVAMGNAMPAGIDIILSVTASYLPRTERRGLHVQSRSYWAPANIGPYSQAISVNIANRGPNALVYVAGQIPLVPASMDILQPTDVSEWSTFCRQAVLSAQHLWRIGIEMGIRWWSGAVVYLASHDHCAPRARLAGEIWRRLHRRPAEEPEKESEMDGPDLWDQRFGRMGSYTDNEPDKPPLPDFKALKYGPKDDAIPAFIAVEVQDTPRNCAIEWQSLGMTGDELEFALRSDYSSLGSARKHPSTVTVRVYAIAATAAPNELESRLRSYGLWEGEPILSDGGKPTTPEVPHATLYTSQPERYHQAMVQCIPCKRLWGKDGRELQAALVVVLET